MIQQYFDEWFPAAYDTARQLRARGGPEQFHWTTHPWLITQLLANITGTVNASQIAAMDSAIRDGLISWHAAPMNLEAEAAEANLYGFGLSLSAQLDARYNKTAKTAISQKDVPGSTIGMVPIAARAGVRSFHVGVNDFSTPPAVPARSPEMYEPCSTFVWCVAAAAPPPPPPPPPPPSHTQSVRCDWILPPAHKVRNGATDWARESPPQQQQQLGGGGEAGAGEAGPPAELVCFWCSGYSQGFGSHAGLTPEMLVSLQPFGSTHRLAFLMTVDNSGPQSAVRGRSRVNQAVPVGRHSLASVGGV
eukprot:COSAG01_NODE_616_length_14815_cov_8.518076_18_plen_305_part_00